MHSCSRIEKRRYQRLQVDLSVLFRVMGPAKIFEMVQGQEFEGKTIDISLGGTAVITSYFLPPKSRLFVKFVIYETDHLGQAIFHEVLTAFAEVRSAIVHHDRRHYRLGLSFQELSEDRLYKLNDIIESSLRFSPVPEAVVI